MALKLVDLSKGKWSSTLSLLSSLLATYILFSIQRPNDGLVPTESMYYGQHLGELSADYFDQIGQITDGGRAPFPHRNFYLNEAMTLNSFGF